MEVWGLWERRNEARGLGSESKAMCRIMCGAAYGRLVVLSHSSDLAWRSLGTMTKGIYHFLPCDYSA